ncbi:MAG: hypothetical protein KKF62_16235 [Bacteroidetes bacterium]|nr:hypothetical protein [Bacteroidota bacterium]MBU1115357.1 hypothetical protein [Bacteroidota bacterium]MBU1800511.1 hypothetical protein [Bacteroidota bacterium]
MKILLLNLMIYLSIFSSIKYGQDLANTFKLKPIPIENFFKKPLTSGYSLSPNGKFMIYRSPVNSINNIFIKEIGKDGIKQLTHSTNRDIMRFFWGNNEIVIYMQDTEGDENYKLYTVNINTLENRCLTDFENSNTEISSFFNKDSTRIIVESNKRDPECYDVYFLNIYSGELQMIEQNPGNVRSWGIDNNGVVRIAYSDKILYRKTNSTILKN